MDIRPFKGWRYKADASGTISKFVAPPYDILSQKDKDALLAGSDKNIVAVDMPHVPPKEVGPDSEYQAAAELLKKWQSSGVMVQEADPSIYAYEQTFKWAGKQHVRRAIFAGVRATPFGQDIIPHEHTFAGPKADRLKLTEYTKMQMSPIFGFYEDPKNTISRILAKVMAVKPTVSGELSGVQEKLWVITDKPMIDEIAAALKKVPVFIADGHHRYTTAMNYRDTLKAAGKIDDNHPANYVMYALVARKDPGLLVLPTHRVVSGLNADFTLEKLRQEATEFEWKSCDLVGVDLSDADAFLRKYGPTAMAFIQAGESKIWIATLKDKGAMAKAAPEESEPWRELDVAILHKLIVDKALAKWKSDKFAIEYTAFGQEVLAACNDKAAQLGICLQGTPLSAIEKIGLAGGAMPHKSTYFYPKLATGMIIKPME